MSIFRISLTIVSIVAILQPTLVYSLPQGFLDSEDTTSVDSGATLFVGSGNTPSDDSGNPPDENTILVSDTYPLDTNGHGSELDAGLPPDYTGPDYLLAANLNPSSSNENNLIIAGNTRGRGPNCKDEGSCPLRADPTDLEANPVPAGTTTTKPKTGNQFEPYRAGGPVPEEGKICPDPWDNHLCGWGPASDSGRVNIPGYFHRTLVVNLGRVVEPAPCKDPFEVCCSGYRISGDPTLNGVGRNCLVLKGVDGPPTHIVRV